MLTTDQKNLILYQAQVWVSDTGSTILAKEQYSEVCDDLYAKSFIAINYLMTLQDAELDLFLDNKQIEAIYKCLQDTLELGNYPVAGFPFTLSDGFDISQGAQGLPGTPGAPGINGTDANQNTVGDPDGNITVTESVVLGIRTFSIKLTPYVLPGISILLDEGVIPDPNQARVVEIGNVIATLSVNVTVSKGRNNVISASVTTPGALNTPFQSSLNLTTINTSGSQIVALTDTNVSTNATYAATVSDGFNNPAVSTSITFVYPYLYGNTNTTSTVGLYSALTRLVKTQATQVVPFAATDDYFWFGLPVEYAALVQIKDENGFVVTGAWTLVATVAVTSTGFGGSNWTHNYNFYRSTVATTINGSFTFVK
jgi:hypothetical protein